MSLLNNDPIDVARRLSIQVTAQHSQLRASETGFFVFVRLKNVNELQFDSEYGDDDGSKRLQEILSKFEDGEDVLQLLTDFVDGRRRMYALCAAGFAWKIFRGDAYVERDFAVFQWFLKSDHFCTTSGARLMAYKINHVKSNDKIAALLKGTHKERIKGASAAHEKQDKELMAELRKRNSVPEGGLSAVDRWDLDSQYFFVTCSHVLPGGETLENLSFRNKSVTVAFENLVVVRYDHPCDSCSTEPEQHVDGYRHFDIAMVPFAFVGRSRRNSIKVDGVIKTGDIVVCHAYQNTNVDATDGDCFSGSVTGTGAHGSLRVDLGAHEGQSGALAISKSRSVVQEELRAAGVAAFYTSSDRGNQSVRIVWPLSSVLDTLIRKADNVSERGRNDYVLEVHEVPIARHDSSDDDDDGSSDQRQTSPRRNTDELNLLLLAP